MKSKIIIALCLVLLIVTFYCNWKFEVVAFNPSFGSEQHELKVMTWNLHCSNGADIERQKGIAELILMVDADIVLLNEYNQDSCRVVDSLLSTKYPFTEEGQSHNCQADIFYSKRMMSNSGRLIIPVYRKSVQTIKATIALGEDSVRVFGVHLMGNQYYDDAPVDTDDAMRVHNTSLEQYKLAQKYRSFQTEWIKKEVMKSNHPVLIMGDMNDVNCSGPLDIFATCGLRDSWWEGGNGYGATFHDGWMRLRIDHILHSDKLKLQSIKVIDTNLSDHNPVVAGFCINN